MILYWWICRLKKMRSDKKNFNRLNSKINNKLRLTMSQRFFTFPIRFIVGIELSNRTFLRYCYFLHEFNGGINH